MKIICQDQLKNHSLCADIIDTHISEWKNGEHFVRYQKRLRPFSGLFFILSDIETVYTESDESGNTILQVRATFCIYRKTFGIMLFSISTATPKSPAPVRSILIYTIRTGTRYSRMNISCC